MILIVIYHIKWYHEVKPLNTVRRSIS